MPGTAIWARLEGLSFQVGVHFEDSPMGLLEILSVLLSLGSRSPPRTRYARSRCRRTARRRAASAFWKSAGRGLSAATRWPVIGWLKASRNAWSMGRRASGPAGGGAAVHRVPQDRQAHVREVDADLVLSAGLELDLQERRPGQALAHAPVRAGVA